MPVSVAQELGSGVRCFFFFALLITRFILPVSLAFAITAAHPHHHQQQQQLSGCVPCRGKQDDGSASLSLYVSRSQQQQQPQSMRSRGRAQQVLSLVLSPSTLHHISSPFAKFAIYTLKSRKK